MERKFLGERLDFEKRVALAQLTMQPGWSVLLELIGEACRQSTEECIKISPSAENYAKIVPNLQLVAHTMSKFAKQIIDSCQVIHKRASTESKAQAGIQEESAETGNRFKGFRPPEVQQK